MLSTVTSSSSITFLLLIFSTIDVRVGTYPSIYPSLFDVTSAYAPKTLGTLATLGFLMPLRDTGMQYRKDMS